MGETLAQKIIRAHLLHGDMTPGSEIALRIDQTLTQDATGTMAYLCLLYTSSQSTLVPSASREQYSVPALPAATWACLQFVHYNCHTD